MFNANSSINSSSAISALGGTDHRASQLHNHHHSSSSTSSNGTNNDSNNNSLYLAGYNQVSVTNANALLTHTNSDAGGTPATNIPPGTQIQLHHVVPTNHHHHQNHTYNVGNVSHHRHQHSDDIQVIASMNGHQQQFSCGGGQNQTIDSTTLSSSTPSQNKKSVDKGSDEYKKRRERNNIAVRKSREKAKMRSRETERRVAELSKENQLYRAQYEELRREFNVLKSLLLKTGLTEQVIDDEAQRYTTTTIQHQQINQVSNNHHPVHNHMASANSNQTQYTNAVIDQWTDGMNAYVEDWAT